MDRHALKWLVGLALLALILIVHVMWIGGRESGRPAAPDPNGKAPPVESGR
jgi:hypothetical protein